MPNCMKHLFAFALFAAALTAFAREDGQLKLVAARTDSGSARSDTTSFILYHRGVSDRPPQTYFQSSEILEQEINLLYQLLARSEQGANDDAISYEQHLQRALARRAVVNAQISVHERTGEIPKEWLERERRRLADLDGAIDLLKELVEKEAAPIRNNKSASPDSKRVIMVSVPRKNTFSAADDKDVPMSVSVAKLYRDSAKAEEEYRSLLSGLMGMSSRPNTWTRTSSYTFPTPFDSSHNWGNKAPFEFYSVYHNVVIIGRYNKAMNESSEKKMFELMNKVVSIFHAYESAKDIRRTAFFELKTALDKQGADGNETTFRIDCVPNEKNADKDSNCWIMAISSKGTLSVNKAMFHFSQRKSVLDNSVYYVPDLDKNKTYSAIPDTPDTVFLTLPAGEKTAELTFYFISEDGTHYSSQSVTLTVPEPASPPPAD